jgi:hypothetical protein
MMLGFNWLSMMVGICLVSSCLMSADEEVAVSKEGKERCMFSYVKCNRYFIVQIYFLKYYKYINSSKEHWYPQKTTL